MHPVITGIGVLAPNGAGLDAYWSATLAGSSGIDSISRFDATAYPAQLAGEVRDFTAGDHLSSRLIAQSDRMTQMALVASDWAVEDAGIDSSSIGDYDMAVVTANASGGNELIQRELHRLWGKGPQHVTAYMSFGWFFAVNTGQISIRHGARGPGCVVMAEQAGGLDALAEARRCILRGHRVALAGGTDSVLCPFGFVPEAVTGRLSGSTDKATAYAPFDVAASGHVAGEGGAILALEDPEAAARRGAPRIYGELAGHGATFDPAPSAGRPPRLRQAAELALADAQVTAAEVDVVFADAAGLRAADRLEAEAISELFGPRRVPVTAPKTMTGRLSAGGGAVDVATALLSLRDDVIPPTVGVTTLAPECEEIDLVREVRRDGELRTALVLARGEGGFNSAVVVRARRRPNR